MKKFTPPAKKTKSYRAYRRAAFWQILLPILVVVLVFITVSVLTSIQGNAVLGKWAAISTIWLSLPVIVFLIINLLVLLGVIYGMAQLLNITPIYMQKLTGYIYLVGEKIASFADAAAEPVVKVGGVSASIRNIFRRK